MARRSQDVLDVCLAALLPWVCGSFCTDGAAAMEHLYTWARQTFRQTMDKLPCMREEVERRRAATQVS